jgi:hypothetical protein
VKKPPKRVWVSVCRWCQRILGAHAQRGYVNELCTCRYPYALATAVSYVPGHLKPARRRKP